jgi:hypothetical protein
MVSLKYLFPIFVIIVYVISFNSITAKEQEITQQVYIDIRPIVNVEEASPTEHQTIITSYVSVRGNASTQ